jgi:hypothetical protein
MKISFSTTQYRPEWETTGSEWETTSSEWETTDSEWRDPATNDERDIQTETGLTPEDQRRITAEVAAHMGM